MQVFATLFDTFQIALELRGSDWRQYFKFPNP